MTAKDWVWHAPQVLCVKGLVPRAALWKSGIFKRQNLVEDAQVIGGILKGIVGHSTFLFFFADLLHKQFSSATHLCQDAMLHYTQVVF